ASVPYVKKDWPRAESELVKALQADGTQVALSQMLATAYIQQAKEKQEKYPLGLYQYARMAAYDGTGSFPAANRKQALDYVTKAYDAYHGSHEGFDQLLATAKQFALPPADFKIKSTKDIAEEEAEKLKKLMSENPMIGVWTKTLKEPLTAENGEAYFEM